MSHILIDYYKAIEDSSAKMLDAAKSEDWEKVMHFEGACAVLIEQLRDRASQKGFSLSIVLRKHASCNVF